MEEAIRIITESGTVYMEAEQISVVRSEHTERFYQYLEDYIRVEINKKNESDVRKETRGIE